MSDILEFIVKNFQRLQPADYALLLAFIALASGALFAAFRWIFAARYQAQKELLDIQRQTVDTLSSHLDYTKKERDELRAELDDKMKRLKDLENQGQSTVKQQDLLREEMLGIVANHLVAFLQRIVIVHQLIFVRRRATDQPLPNDAILLLERFSEQVERLQAMYQATYDQPNRESLPALVAFFDSDEISKCAHQVFKRFMSLARAAQVEVLDERAVRG